MADTLESLEIEVRHSATGAADAITNVTNAIRGMSRAIGNALPRLTALNEALGGGSLTLNNIDAQVTATVNNVSNVSRSAGRATNTLSRGLHSMSNAAKKANGPLQNFISSLKRIAFYRFIRSVIKAITQAFSEGLEKAYLFSSRIAGEGHRFAEALDRMASVSNQMKGQLGAAFAGLLTAIEPILANIINMITRVADALSQFFAAFTGSTYLKAIAAQADFADKTAKGAKAAKEYKNQLLKFDEINRLEDKSSSGSGGKDPMKGYAFSDSPISERIKTFVQQLKDAVNSGDWGNVGRLIGEKVNDGLKAIYMHSGELGRTLVGFITNGIDFLLGAIDQINWNLVGLSICSFLTNAISEASSWLDTKDWEAVGVNLWNNFKELVNGFDFNGIARQFFNLFGKACADAVLLLRGFFAEAWEKVKEYFSKKTEEAGGNVVLGFLKGIFDALVDIVQWIHDNVLIPFVDAFRKAFGIHSPSTVMAEIGEQIVAGLKKGVEDAWNSFTKFFEDAWDNFKKWWEGLSLSPFHIPTPHFTWGTRAPDGWFEQGAASVLSALGLPAAIPTLSVNWYAGGGFPDAGQLFVANEAGPEMVGRIGNRTAVGNQDQIIEGIRRGVYDAVASAMGNGNSDRPIKVYLDGKEISTAVTKNQRQLSRATGVAMA